MASNFTEAGTTSGFWRRSGRVVHHGAKETYWFRLLCRDAIHLLAHPSTTQRLQTRDTCVRSI